ncbi:hypothetical protein [Streptomyces sp. VRA16 Mangrove soil]|uniref:hypothetical protein n=1 Tax=Streptomyces sp. VRA16 Mangrove soil TaxID=2817434 RepID=UPI001A9D9E7A|nr:hypothetical protein [Streptomyces sp. VRA16 Mangrove soil]MBO1330124.1 hypothetical protein [Streptomyces sp. VRA16 Mangrove soil]
MRIAPPALPDRSVTAAATALAAVAAVVGATAYTVVTLTTGDERVVVDSIMAQDLSRDEYLANASRDVFHGTVVGLKSQAGTDQPGEREQLWRVRVNRAFKGDASGTVIVDTVAYTAGDGSLTAEGGAVVPEPGRMYVFSGIQEGSTRVYHPYGGTVGTRPSPGLDEPFGLADGARPLHPERFRGARTVTDYWTTVIRNETEGPAPDRPGAAP